MVTLRVSPELTRDLRHVRCRAESLVCEETDPKARQCVLRVNGFPYRLARSFKPSFARMSRIAATSMRNGFHLVFNAHLHAKPIREVGLYLDETDHSALSVFPRNVTAIHPAVAREIVERNLADHPRVSVDMDALATHITVIDDEAHDLLGGGIGAFRFGAHVVIPHDGAPIIPLYVATERVVCTNGAVARHRELTFRLDADVRFGQLVGEIGYGIRSVSKHPERLRWLHERLRAMRATVASLQELLEAHRALDSCGLGSFAGPLRIEEVLDAYGAAHVQELPHRWRCTASTPLTRLDVFNVVTEVARHCTARETPDGISARQRLMVLAGNFLAATGHLEGVAPSMAWQRAPEREFYVERGGAECRN